jgi:alanyl-tRNA synthetase
MIHLFSKDLTALILKEKGYTWTKQILKLNCKTKARSRAASEVSTEDWSVLILKCRNFCGL